MLATLAPSHADHHCRSVLSSGRPAGAMFGMRVLVRY
jgi:hypothetical protein